MRRLSIMVLALAFVCSLTACSSIDWVDFVKWDNIIYVRDTTTDSIPKEYIGDLIGSVKKVAPSIVRIPNYKPKNGMAAFLELDTEFYEIIGYDSNRYIAVLTNEEYVVYKTIESKSIFFQDSVVSTSDLRGKIIDVNGASILLVNMEKDAGSSDIYWINVDKVNIIGANGSALNSSALKRGMLVDVIYDGTIQESFPMGLGGISNIYIKEQSNDIVGLYRTVVDDLYAVDPGLNADANIFAFDLTGVSNLTEVEKAALIYLVGNTYQVETIAGTFDELHEQGYINKDELYFEKGILFIINDTAMSGDQFTFDAEKWRSGLGAYYFSDCTAKKTARGWNYNIGVEMIS
ncbi:MAG: hypothetical protein GX962_06175 [Epulopiscium sp.]|nr:hypothetical protein [Candidatus Epulonipiscium sp.]